MLRGIVRVPTRSGGRRQVVAQRMRARAAAARAAYVMQVGGNAMLLSRHVERVTKRGAVLSRRCRYWYTCQRHAITPTLRHAPMPMPIDGRVSAI